MTNEFGETELAIRSAVEQQGFTRLVGATLDVVEPGRVVLSLERRDQILQQNGFVHGGAIAYLVDNATTCAAATQIRRDAESCLTAEYKLSFLAPATGSRIVCEAETVKPGRKLSVVEARVYSETGSERKLCAIALATVAIVPRAGPAVETGAAA